MSSLELLAIRSTTIGLRRQVQSRLFEIPLRKVVKVENLLC